MPSTWSTPTHDASRMSIAVDGLLARPDRLATVHSVFRTVVNVRTGNTLIALASEDGGGLPNGILVGDRWDPPALAVRPGMAVVLHSRLVRIPAAGVHLDLGSTARWSARMPSLDGSAWAGRSAIAHGATRTVAEARAGGRRSGPASGLDGLEGARPALEGAARALRGGDLAAGLRSARTLVGRGPGLTPSGDDALTGLAAALAAIAHPAAGFLAAMLDDVDERTTAVSAAMLRHAARGEFTERLHRLLEALLGDAEAIPAAIERASAWGATSGSDGVAGVLAGLDAAA